MRKTSLHLFLLVAALVFVNANFAQFKLTDKLPVDSSVRIGKLANGLTYYIKKNNKPEHKAELRLVVNAGSILEDDDQLGLAHFMEHMNFNGTKHFPKNELVNYLQSIGVEFGADLNAYTSFDETVYMLPIPTDNPAKLDSGLTILEDWAGNALLDTTEINKERGVVLEESRLGKGAGERMRNKYLPELFNGSLYARRLPIGSDEVLCNFTPFTLKRFYTSWYRPDLEAIVIVGDINIDETEAAIKKHFSHFENPAAEKERPSNISIPARDVSRAMVLTDKEETNTILQIYNYVEKAEPVITWEDYRKTVIENIFSTLINQRLSELTQQAEPPFIFGNTGFNPFLRGYRSFVSFAFVGDKPLKEAIEALVKTTESVKKFGFLQTELDRAKISLINQTERAYTDRDKTESMRLVQSYVNNYLTQSPIPGIENRYKFLQQILPAISLQEVNELATKMESTQGKFVLVTAPQKDSSRLPPDKDVLAIVSAAQQLPVQAYEEKSVASSLLDKKPVQGKVVKESTNKLLSTTDFTLNNGITITIKSTEFKNDEIQMDAWRWGGSYNYSLQDKQMAQNAANIVMAMGIKDMSPIDLRKFLAGKTISVQPYINTLDEGIQGTSGVKDFETFLQIVYLYFTQPRFDDALFKSFITKQKSFLQNAKNNPFTYFQDTIAKIQFNNNPWVSGMAKPEDYDNISGQKTLELYKSVFGNAYGMHFTFVGNIDVAKVKPLIETYLASLPSKQKENKFTDLNIRPVKGVINAVVKKGEDKKSLVNIIFNGEAEYSQDEALKLNVLTSALNIKVIEQLREEMSGIYGGGIYGQLTKRPYNNYSITASFPCGPENVDKLSAAIFDIIKQAREKGIEQKDLDKVKETFKKDYEENMQQNDYWLESLSYAWIDKNDPEWMLSFLEKLNKITPADMQKAAQKYFDMNNYLNAVLKPEKQ